MAHDGPTIAVNLAALARNYRTLSKAGGSAACAAVVKANGYGLGDAAVSQALYNAGCRQFFVATLDEAIALKPYIKDAELFVFHGVGENEERDFIAHSLIPILNTPAQIRRWQTGGRALPSALHIDTGMNRLGVSAAEAEAIAQDAALRESLNLTLIMSHLACADEPAHPMNAAQKNAFAKAAAYFPGTRASLANSAGIFLGDDFHFALTRPGCALYGINPSPGQPNPIEHVATLTAPVLQVRTLKKAEPVGYGATATLPAGSRVATVALGYADGFFRLLGNKALAHYMGIALPLVGRVSMDMVMLDVSRAQEGALTAGAQVSFIGPEQTVNDVAEMAGTIGYEVFTRLGQRVRRRYVEDGQ